MPSKLIEVNNCGDCPYKRFGVNTESTCSHEDARRWPDNVLSMYNIRVEVPKFCPLREGPTQELRIIKLNV